MSAITLPTAPAQPIFAGEQHIIFRNSSWATYQRLLLEREGFRPRLAYDQGVLEIMTTSLQHEKLVRLFEALINALANEIWRYQDDTVTILRLTEGSYQRTGESGCFRGVTSNRLSA